MTEKALTENAVADDPLGEPEAPRRQVGARAGILAGLTLGVAAVGVATLDISTVVSFHAPGAGA
ncbi:hypothetical protein FHX82_005073 [Amycolatopsis bartoniae]|uniref:Uncharacterized protein n=1 Tax=Amycolatopsis bartoniae TaxID=941986 RepID=A0A8H9ISU6_9PSEU|nr:hypothetical protein [Amycolatopsis bartoniae]MBB2937997.1 hypothetical protein [Amycolatopsis bartoniae]TVT07570.1 hypothetical protein FNH07_15475 [Amycolatopsis bartoniae]GHF42205.1 hypothetical protein GCM10017566_14740 [Amycolatopsis bartoniae]